MSTAPFWQPKLEISTQDDGSVLISQSEPLPDHDKIIAEYLEYWADESPDSVWLGRRSTGGDWTTITYKEALSIARTLGAALIDLDLGHEKPLLILSKNSLEHGLLSIACTYVGIPYAPVSPAYSLLSNDHEKLRYIAQLVKPGAIFADDGSAFETALEKIATTETIIINHENYLPAALHLNQLIDSTSQSYKAARSAVTENTTVKYLFTSGSTGSPKAVINTNKMICSMQAMVRDCYRFVTTEPPIILDWAPWNHTAAGNKVFYMAMTNGGSYYIDDGKPSPTGIKETIRNLKEISCTWYFNVPAGYDLLVEALENDNEFAQNFFSNLRMLFYAGAGMAQHTWDRLAAVGLRTTGEDVLIASSLGATETAPFALAWTEHETTAGNIGVPSRDLIMKLTPSGDKLELRLKGPSITPGYLGDEKKTAEAFDKDGFYIMGDALRPVDPNDYSRGFYFDGRIAENFKLATGTWVAVGAVRLALVNAMGGLVRDAVIIGEDRKEVGALVWLSENALSIPADQLRQAMTEKLRMHASDSTGSASKVMRVGALLHAPEFDKGEITEKSSLNQRMLRTNNAAAINEIYEIETDENGMVVKL